MNITCDECYDTPKGEASANSTAEKHLLVKGTWSESEAYQAAASWVTRNAPVVRLNLYPNSITYDPIEGTPAWDFHVRYTKRVPPRLQQTEYRFSTTGGTEKLTQSFRTVSMTPCGGGVIPNFHGGIGYDGEHFEGVDVKRPRFAWTETVCFPYAFVNRAYLRMLRHMTGSVSSTPFDDFDAFEVMFDGVTDGGTVTDTDENGDPQRYWKLTYSFEAMPNRQGIVINGCAPVDKRAWDYLWVLKQKNDDTDSKRVIHKPLGVYVEEVYEYADFAALMLPPRS